MTILGIDRLVEISDSKIKGKRVGLITNNTARGSDLASTFEKVRSVRNIEKLVLLSPEHGYFGDHQSGSTVNSYFDSDLNIQIESLYRKPEGFKDPIIGDIDLSMRTIDSQRDSSKYPEKKIMQNFDTVIFDLQDVGCRIYTYIATLIYSMEISAGLEQDYIVLDRPNPITGKNPEGPILESSLFSFIGSMPVPMRHSLTIGEIALFFNRFINKGKTNLTVLGLKGWERSHWHDQTFVPWVPPSPNMPTLDTAVVYPGAILFEGTNVSEGRGTTRPFQIIGAPWINGLKLKEKLGNLGRTGAQVIEMKFRPTFSKYAGSVCNGLYLHVNDREIFRPLEFALDLIGNIMDMYADEFSFHDSYFDKASGNKKIREMLLSGSSGRDILEKFEDELTRYESGIAEIKIYK